MSTASFAFPPRTRDKRLSPTPEAHLTSLHARVWIARQAKRLSQQDLADLAGISRKTVHNIETDKRWPTLIVAMKIAATLEMTVEELFSLK
jgi:putative transcriptional regulator